jgi:putative transposase
MEAQKARKPYPTDLKDKEWAKIEHLIPLPKSGGKSTIGGCPPKYDRREILNALFYMTKAGCTWRMLPHDLPPWEVVYMYFAQWRDDGVFEHINAVLRRRIRVEGRIRVEVGKDQEPSAAIIDSQSVKTAEKGGLAAAGARLATMLVRKSREESDTSS